MDPATAEDTTVTKTAIDVIVSVLVNIIVTLLLQTLKYLFKVGANVRALQPAIDALSRTRNDVRTRVQTGQRQGEQVANEVDGWIKRVGDIENEVRVIKQKYQSRSRSLGDLSFNCWSDYQISKNATILLSNIQALHTQREGFQVITIEESPPTVQEVPIGSTSTQTAISNLELARQYINDEPVGVIGIRGMGGVGKTHLLENINNSYLEESPFNVVVLVTASKDCSIEKMQACIIEKLGLVKDSNKKKDIIFNFLRERNFLLLIDDLWEEIDLTKVGIPFPLGLTDKYKRKVVLTTRLKGVCGQMVVRREIQVALLNEDESWALFRDNVGHETLDPHPPIKKLAKQVVKQLGSLPLALITIGRAMYGKTKPENWQNAIDQLKASSSSQINDDIEKVFHRLKLSYENLSSETLKNCFLFCSLWPEDHHFVRNDLIKCWIGLGYIEEPDIQNAYNKGHEIIDELLRRCLLEEYHNFIGEIIDEVKMHDLIRDMAHWIACDFGANKNKWIIKTGGSSRMPSHEKLWHDAECISFMHHEFLVESNAFSLGKVFFVGSHSVLSSPSNLTTLLLPKNMLKTLPINISFLTNLRYLNLASNKLSVVPLEICKLTNLQYLNLSDNPIDSIPAELKALTNLKFLYMKLCNININSLPDGVILALKSLEVLDLFKGIDFSIVDNYSFVEELKSLKNLKALGITIDSSGLEKFNGLPLHSLDVLLSLNLESNFFSINSNFSMETYRYLVYLSFNYGDGYEYFVIERCHFPNLEKLSFITMSDLRDIEWRGVLAKDVFPRLKYLHILSCNIEHITWIAQLPCLEILSVCGCINVKELVRSNEGSSSTSRQQSCQQLYSLKSINLDKLKKLESICDPNHYTFPSLKYLDIARCPNLKKLPFPNGSVPHTVKLNTRQRFDS